VKHDIAPLEQGVRQFDAAVARIFKLKLTETLVPIFKRPGWTTPAELSFSTAMLESLNAQLEVVAKLQARFAAAAKQVGQG
jgi:hypothetical protein